MLGAKWRSFESSLSCNGALVMPNMILLLVKSKKSTKNPGIRISVQENKSLLCIKC